MGGDGWIDCDADRRTHAVLDELDAYLWPVLREREFAAAQCGDDGDGVGSAIYCAALSDIRALRLGVHDGHLPDDQLVGAECFDVTTRVAGGVVTQIDTDGGTLDELLDERRLLDEAAAVRDVLGREIAVAGPVVAGGLRALFAPGGE